MHYKTAGSWRSRAFLVFFCCLLAWLLGRLLLPHCWYCRCTNCVTSEQAVVSVFTPLLREAVDFRPMPHTVLFFFCPPAGLVSRRSLSFMASIMQCTHRCSKHRDERTMCFQLFELGSYCRARSLFDMSTFDRNQGDKTKKEHVHTWDGQIDHIDHIHQIDHIDHIDQIDHNLDHLDPL